MTSVGYDQLQLRQKSGKTTLNGALTLCWGFTQEAPNELLILANDLEQAKARTYKTMEGLLKEKAYLEDSKKSRLEGRELQKTLSPNRDFIEEFRDGLA